MNPKVAVADDLEDSGDDDEEAGVRGEEQNNKTTIWGVSAHQKQQFTNVIIYCLCYNKMQGKTYICYKASKSKQMQVL